MANSVDEITLRQLIGIGQIPDRPPSLFASNARYLSSLDGFNIGRPSIPPHVFVAERDRALRQGASTGLIALDLSGQLGLGHPATTPLILARYARICPGETLATSFRASTEFHYVIRGKGRTTFEGGREAIDWAPGDIFCLPGGANVRHASTQSEAVLWTVTDEPQLAHERCRPPALDAPPFEPVHYPAEEIRRRILGVYLDPRGAAMPGKTVNFGNVALEADRTTAPTLMLALNSLLPGEAQRGHRHNAVAVTLVIAGEGCYSMIDGHRIDWESGVVSITPPASFHSHHNEGNGMALFLIVQDGGLYYHCRTMGFSLD